jgi:DNA-binding protein WhiA
MRREVRATANRLANFDDANLRRSARAAVAASARVARAKRQANYVSLTARQVLKNLVLLPRLR